MNLIICLFGPSLLGVGLFNRLNKNYNKNNLIMLYGIFFFVINYLTSLFCYFIYHVTGNISEMIKDSLVFGLKYSSVSILFTIIVVVLTDIIIKNINLSFEVVRNEKKN